jgi:predicted aspartyl protease
MADPVTIIQVDPASLLAAAGTIGTALVAGATVAAKILASWLQSHDSAIAAIAAQLATLITRFEASEIQRRADQAAQENRYLSVMMDNTKATVDLSHTIRGLARPAPHVG